MEQVSARAADVRAKAASAVSAAAAERIFD
jgi:hypothetical protein